jgi:hypothetical protein
VICNALLPPKIIIISRNIIFSGIVTALYFDDHKKLTSCIRKTMKMTEWDMTSFIGPEHADLLHSGEIWITDIDGSDS